MDSLSRRIVDWSAAGESRPALDAPGMGLWPRDRDRPPPRTGELVHHGDAGSRYTSFALAGHLAAAGIAASIGPVGDAYANVLMGSTIGLHKTEPVTPRRPRRSLAQVETATAGWTDWYHHTRLRGETRHAPPAEYEANRYLTTTEPQVTTNI